MPLPPLAAPVTAVLETAAPALSEIVGPGEPQIGAASDNRLLQFQAPGPKGNWLSK